MKILALEVERAGATAADFDPLLKAEAAHLWKLQQAGILREAFFRTDRHTAVLVFECSDLEQCRAEVSAFPLVQAGLISFEFIPLGPYDGFARLFA
jgi:hypothetical protein